MDDFHVPILSSTAFNDSQNINTTSHTTTHHHKDHMLATGSSTVVIRNPGANYLFNPNRFSDIPTTSTSLKSELSAFTNCIQQSTLLDQRGSVVVDSSNGANNLNNVSSIVDSNLDSVSMSGLCDFKVPSPSFLSNTLNNDSNFKNLTPLLNHQASDLNSTDSSLPVSSFSNLLFPPPGREAIDLENKTNSTLHATQPPHYLPLRTINSTENRFLQRHHSQSLMPNETFPNSNNNNDDLLCEPTSLPIPSLTTKAISVITPSSSNVMNFNLSTNITSSMPTTLKDSASSNAAIIASKATTSTSTTNLDNFIAIRNNFNYVTTTTTTKSSSPAATLTATTSTIGSPRRSANFSSAATTVLTKIPNNGASNKECDSMEGQITTTITTIQTNPINKNTANNQNNNSNNNNQSNQDVTNRISFTNNYNNNTGITNKNNSNTTMVINNHITVASDQEKNLINHQQQQHQQQQHQQQQQSLQQSLTNGGNLVTSHHVSSLHNIEELAVSSCSIAPSSSTFSGASTSPSKLATSATAISSSPPPSSSNTGPSTIITNLVDTTKNKDSKGLNKKISQDEHHDQNQVQSQNQNQHQNANQNPSQQQHHQLQNENQQQLHQHHQQLQQQHQQHLHMQQLHQQNSHDFSINSSECDSMSSDDDSIDLEINEHNGYQDNTSSHSQQSNGGSGGGGGGGGGNGNGSNNGNPNSNSTLQAAAQAVMGGNASNYMSLLPPSNASGHLLTTVAGNVNGTSVGGLVTTGVGGTSASAGGPSGESIDFKHLFEELCPVCGDKVSGYHYGLLTCESCKGFFKRTVQNKKVYTCVAERSCHIDKTQRKRCPFCRFQKCLEVGMKLEAVRADRMRGGRNKFGPMYKRDRARKLQMMRQRQLALQALRSTIGSADMKPTPLSPGYQQAYPNMNIKQEIQIPQVSSLTQSPDSSPSPIAIALGQVNASTSVITTAMNGNSGAGGGSSSGGGGNSNSDIINRSSSGNCHDPGSLPNTGDSKLCFDSGTHPSSTADSSIEPLRVSPMIREFVQSIDDREWQTQLFALLQKQTYNQVEVDLFELMCKVLDQNLFSQVDWARNTVFFKDLKVDDQMKLLQHSWSDMLVLDHLHQRIHNGLPDETQLNNGQVFNLLGLGLLGVPQLADYFNELQNKLQDLKFDMGDYVCMKFLILLNPDVRGIINKKTVLEGHENVQAALLDYTLTCYPSVTDKFRRLLNILPEIHAMAARGEEHLYSKHCAGSAPTQTLLMEMLHAKRKV